MKLIILCCLLGAVLAQEEPSCRAELNDFGQCVRDVFPEEEDGENDHRKEREEKMQQMGQCFVKSGCTDPSVVMKKMKDCVKAELEENVFLPLRSCVEEKSGADLPRHFFKKMAKLAGKMSGKFGRGFGGKFGGRRHGGKGGRLEEKVRSFCPADFADEDFEKLQKCLFELRSQGGHGGRRGRGRFGRHGGHRRGGRHGMQKMMGMKQCLDSLGEECRTEGRMAVCDCAPSEEDFRALEPSLERCAEEAGLPEDAEMPHKLQKLRDALSALPDSPFCDPQAQFPPRRFSGGKRRFRGRHGWSKNGKNGGGN